MSGCAILDSGIAARQNGKRLPCEVLQAENASLREQVDAAHMSRLLTENENESLRELVRDMWDFFCVVPEDEPHAFKEELDFSVEVWKRMRELGIEVE